MRVDEEQDQLEKTKAEQFAAETPRLEGVESVSVELGDDQTGDPAMWLVFRTKRDLDTNKEWHRRFLDYAAVIQTKILHSGLTRFPYTRLE